MLHARLALVFFPLSVGITIEAFAQFPLVAPQAAGFSATRLERIDSLIHSYIEAEQLAGAVALVLRDGKAVHQRYIGLADRENSKPMNSQTIFRLASMTKAVTTAAVMMLYEEGRFLLNDPIDRFIPEFKDPRVALPSPEGEGYITVPAKSPIRIRHLLTHQAGLTYGDGVAAEAYKAAGLQGWYFADKDESIGQCVRRLAGLPLHGHPGETWQYGYATDVLGYLVEVVSGMPLDRFFEERIFRPLGMHDTHFFLPLEKADRLAPLYRLDEEGRLQLVERAEDSDYLHGPRRCFSGGAGLLSTAGDYGRFLLMLLNEGELDAKRLLSPKSVALMCANHLGDRYPWGNTGFGLGFWVIEDIGHYGEVGSVGAYGWGSAYYPVYWIDPEERLVGMLFAQLRPAAGLPLHDRFRSMVYHAIVRPKGER
jgi:CubicO group peptidase (beta-lactamase class C family)